jgi:hypothetical protein
MTEAPKRAATGGVIAAMPDRPRAASALTALLVAACSVGAGGPSPVPTPAVAHSTDPTVLLLRAGQAGGIVAPSFEVTRTPVFSLFGDGTVIYQLPADPNDAPGPGPAPLARAQMNAEQVDALLAFALDAGALEASKELYVYRRVADPPVTFFIIATPWRSYFSVTKLVRVQALGSARVAADPDGPTLQALGGLWDLLANFLDQVRAGNATDAGIYEPTAYRGILSEGQPQGQGIDWPWSDLTPDDFVASDKSGLRIAVLTPAQAKTLSLAPQGGLFATPVFGPDRVPYTIALRPLLPDETK